MSHVNNPELLKRLRRAEGHLSTVVRMVAEGRGGLVIAQQTRVVIGALERVMQTLILDHIDHHLAKVAGPLPPDLQRKIAAFRETAKYL